MKTIIKFLTVFIMTVATTHVVEASGGAGYEKAHIDSSNMSSLQNGAKLYINYCLGCHSLKYQRYERMADDLQIPKDIVMKNMMFTSDKLVQPCQLICLTKMRRSGLDKLLQIYL